MILSYSDIRELDRRLTVLEANIALLVGRDTEIANLKARIAELEGQIAAAVDTSADVEQGARDGLPAA